MNQGDTEVAKKILDSFKSLSSIVSHMNNKAVIQVRLNKTDVALELYDRTLASIPDDRVEIIATVLYNKSLTLIRLDRLPAARDTLAQSLKLASDRLRKKVLSLKSRVDRAIKQSTDVQLRLADEKVATGESTMQNNLVMETAKIQPGEICCHLIYVHPAGRDPTVDSLMGNKPRFNPRKAITREEGMGAEKMLKSGG